MRDMLGLILTLFEFSGLGQIPSTTRSEHEEWGAGPYGCCSKAFFPTFYLSMFYILRTSVLEMQVHLPEPTLHNLVNSVLGEAFGASDGDTLGASIRLSTTLQLPSLCFTRCSAMVWTRPRTVDLGSWSSHFREGAVLFEQIGFPHAHLLSQVLDLMSSPSFSTHRGTGSALDFLPE